MKNLFKSNFESDEWLQALDRIKIDESQPDHVILFPHGISDMETGDEDSEGMGFTLNFVLFSNCYVIVL